MSEEKKFKFPTEVVELPSKVCFNKLKPFKEDPRGMVVNCWFPSSIYSTKSFESK